MACYSYQVSWKSVRSKYFRMGQTHKYKDTVESRLSDFRLSDIPFYPTCRVGTLHFINSHSEGLNSIEQQREATATDVLLFRRWRDLAAKKRKEAQKQIPIVNFLNEINSSIYKFALYFFYFCLWDFFIWYHIVFSSQFNKIINRVDIYPLFFISLPYYPTFSIILPSLGPV
jgi:hypothetical protein